MRLFRQSLIRDTGYGWRALCKTPAFTLGAIVSAALAGVACAIPALRAPGITALRSGI